MAALDYLQRDALIYPHGVDGFVEAELEAGLELINTEVVHFPELFVDLLLHLLVLQKGNEGVPVFARELFAPLLFFLSLSSTTTIFIGSRYSVAFLDELCSTILFIFDMTSWLFLLIYHKKYLLFFCWLKASGSLLYGIRGRRHVSRNSTF